MILRITSSPLFSHATCFLLNLFYAFPSPKGPLSCWCTSLSLSLLLSFLIQTWNGELFDARGYWNDFWLHVQNDWKVSWKSLTIFCLTLKLTCISVDLPLMSIDPFQLQNIYLMRSGFKWLSHRSRIVFGFLKHLVSVWTNKSIPMSVQRDWKCCSFMTSLKKLS